MMLKPMLRPAMSDKQIYLWGVLFASAREQLGALNDLSAGRLGVWGKMRIKARRRFLENFLKKLMREYAKIVTNEFSIVGNIACNLREIRDGTSEFGKVGDEEFRYICRILDIQPFR